MYKLKPIVEVWPNLDLPQTMYNMKSVANLTLNDGKPPTNTNVELNELDELAARQAKILLQLEEFKKQLARIKSNIGKENVTTAAKPSLTRPVSVVTKVPVDTQHLQDIVVNVNPRNVPYCILGLKRLWTKRLNIQIEVFTHSTVSQLGDAAMNFVNKVKSLQDQPGLPTLKVTIIWKEVGNNLEVVASPTSYVPLQGEVNLVRLLSRVGPNEHNYEQSGDDATEVDTIFDICYLLSNATNVKDRLSQLRLLNGRLGKQKYFGGGAISVVDVAVSSVIWQLDVSKDLTPALKTWLKAVSSELGY